MSQYPRLQSPDHSERHSAHPSYPRALGIIERRIDAITPYFVPGAAGVEAFAKRRKAMPGIPDDLGIFGSSGASLHAKTFAVDGVRIFIGSFNFDPRSIQ